MLPEDKIRELNLSYTSRDYASIFSDLVNSISSLTKTWTTREETDPGIVLIKLMSMLGDMLSYNQDKQALEVFPNTVKQRKNAAQIFRLIGYKMRWFRSATTNISIHHNILPEGMTIIPRYTKFYTPNKEVCYTNYNEQIELLNMKEGIKLTQGVPVTPTLINTIIPRSDNDPWHSVYGYNILMNDISFDTIYLRDTDIDESSIVLIDDETGTPDNEWTLVDNINVSSITGKIFELCIDDNNQPYLKLPSYWTTNYKINKFKLFYLISAGSDGEIMANTLSIIEPNSVYINVNSDSNSNFIETRNIVIYNDTSTIGYNPEVTDEARINAENYQNTINTLVTLDDYTKAIKREESVANCIATDCTNDPNRNELDKYLVNLYIIRDDSYVTLGSALNYEGLISDEDYIQNLHDKVLTNYKTIINDVNIKLEDSVTFVNWDTTGLIYLKEPVTTDRARDILSKITQNLSVEYSSRNMKFNSPVNFVEVVESIEDSNSNIRHVDLDPIMYNIVTVGTNETDGTVLHAERKFITGEYTHESKSSNIGKYHLVLPRTTLCPICNTIFNTAVELINSDPCPVCNSIPENHDTSYSYYNDTIKPGSVTVNIMDNFNIYDNGGGRLMSPNGILANIGTINYDTRTLDFELSISVPSDSDVKVYYTVNRVNMTRYMSVNDGRNRRLEIAPECIRDR